MSEFRTYQCACDRPITNEADMRAHVAAGHGEPPPGVIPPTPAAMLGEAEDLLRRAGDLLLFVSRDMPSNHRLDEAKGAASNAHSFTLDVLHDLKREAEARRVNCPRGLHGGHGSDACDCAAIAKTGANSCWQCEAPLGNTEACLTCAAKRAEERVVGTGPVGGSGILVMGGSAPAAGSIMGTGTTDETLADFVERTEGAPHPALRLLK